MIVAHEGDYIELTLVNPKTSRLPHNIDFHASTGVMIPWHVVHGMNGTVMILPQEGLESWVIAAGSAGAFIHTFRQPGLYVYLSHNLIEAILFGAAAHVKVEGEWNNDLMEQVKPPSPVQ